MSAYVLLIVEKVQQIVLFDKKRFTKLLFHELFVIKDQT